MLPWVSIKGAGGGVQVRNSLVVGIFVTTVDGRCSLIDRVLLVMSRLLRLLRAADDGRQSVELVAIAI